MFLFSLKGDRRLKSTRPRRLKSRNVGGLNHGLHGGRQLVYLGTVSCSDNRADFSYIYTS
jgi:hypothetical protein